MKGGFIDAVGVDEKTEDNGGTETGEEENDGGESDQEEESLIEDGTDGCVVSFSIAAADHNLYAGTEAESEHKDGEIVDTCQG